MTLAVATWRSGPVRAPQSPPLSYTFLTDWSPHPPSLVRNVQQNELHVCSADLCNPPDSPPRMGHSSLLSSQAEGPPPLQGSGHGIPLLKQSLFHTSNHAPENLLPSRPSSRPVLPFWALLEQALVAHSFQMPCCSPLIVFSQEYGLSPEPHHTLLAGSHCTLHSLHGLYPIWFFTDNRCSVRFPLVYQRLIKG